MMREWTAPTDELFTRRGVSLGRGDRITAGFALDARVLPTWRPFMPGHDHATVPLPYRDEPWCVPASNQASEWPWPYHLLATVLGKRLKWISDSPHGRLLDVPIRVAFSPDGKAILAQDRDRVGVWDGATGCELAPLPDTGRRCLLTTYGPCVCRLEGTIGHLHNLATGEQHAVDLTVLEGSPIQGAANGEWLVLSSPVATHSWSLRSPHVSQLDPHLGITELAAAGSLALFRHEDRIAGHDLRTGMLVWEVWPEQDQALSATFMPDGQHLVVCRTGSHARLERLRVGQTNREPLAELGSDFAQAVVTRMAVSPDGRWCALGGPGLDITVLDLSGGRPPTRFLSGHRAPITCLAFSPDSRWIVSGGHDQRVRVHDWRIPWPPTPAIGPTSAVQTAAFSRTGKVLLTGARNGQVHVWDGDTGTLHRTVTWHTREVRLSALSSDGRLAATASYNGVVLWETQTGMRRVLIHELAGLTRQLAFSPDDRQLMIHQIRLTRVYDTFSGRLVGQSEAPYWGVPPMPALMPASINPPLEFSDHVTCVAESPMRHRLAIGTARGLVLLYE